MPDKSFRLAGVRTGSRRSSILLEGSSGAPSSYGSSVNDSNILVKALLTIGRLVPVSVIEHYVIRKHDTGIVPHAESFEAAVLFADISGFSSLAEKLVGESGSSVKSAEQLSKHIGKSLNLMVKTVTQYGGDVIKFAGDAILVLFRAKQYDHSLRDAINCAIFVALKVIGLDLKAGDVKLAVHCGIGAGEVFGNHIGGLHNRWEYVITGDPIDQVGSAEPEANPGEVVLSQYSASLVQEDIVGTTLESGNVLIQSQKSEIDFQQKRGVFSTLRSIQDLAEIKRLSFFLRSYVPRPAILAIECNKGDWIAELRFCSIVFCRILGLTFSSLIDLKVIQVALFTVQKYVYKYEGTLCRFIVDDKGAGILFAFGLPPFMHENDALRAVKASFEIHQEITKVKNSQNETCTNLDASLGVTSGKVFCGTVGGSTRCEYTLHGTLVNLAARFMVAAKSGVLCSEETYVETKEEIVYEDPVELKVKGKEDFVKAFRPSSIVSQEVNLQESILNLKLLPGRDAQHEEIKSIITKLSHAYLQRGFLLIEGEAGSGKSYCTKFAHKVALECCNIHFIQSRALDTEKSKPLFMWRNVLRQLLAAHYTKALGQYFYLERERPNVTAYIGTEDNPLKFPFDFFERVLELGLPSFESLSSDMKALVLKDMMSTISSSLRDKVHSVMPLLPEYFNDVMAESQNHENIDLAVVSGLINTVVVDLKTKRSIKRVDGFRSSVQSILGADYQQLSFSELRSMDSKQSSKSNNNFHPHRVEKKESTISSVFGFGRRKKNTSSSSLTFNNMKTPEVPLEKTGSSKSEPPINLLFNREYLGGSKDVFISGFMRMAQCSKIVFCFDDIEYADNQSWQLLENLLQNQQQILVIVTKRKNAQLSGTSGDFLGGLESLENFQVLSLPNLGQEDLREAISLWTDSKGTSDKVVSLVYERSLGQPFFSEELVKLLLEKKYLKLTGGVCHLSDKAKSGNIELPNNISALIVAKLDRLAPIQLDILKKLSVFGSMFTKDAAYALISEYQQANSTLDTVSIYKEFRALKDLGFLVESSNNLSFQSSLLRESAYSLLLFQERKDIHLIIAKNLNAKHNDYLDLVTDKLAYHYYLAEEYVLAKNEGVQSKAIYFLEQYSTQRAAAQDNQEAYKAFSKLVSVDKYAMEVDGDGKETEMSLLKRTFWFLEMAKACIALKIYDEGIDYVIQALGKVGFVFRVPSPLELKLFSRTRHSAYINLFEVFHRLMSQQKTCRMVLITLALVNLARSYESVSIRLASFCYFLASEAVTMVQQLLMKNAIPSMTMEKAYNAILTYYSYFSLFNIVYFERRLTLSNEHTSFALKLRNKTNDHTVRLRVLLNAIAQTMLAGNLTDTATHIQEACWTAKFSQNVEGIIDAYRANVLSSLFKGKIVQAYMTAQSAALASPSDIFVKLTGFLAIRCSQYAQAKQILLRLCRIQSMSVEDEKLMKFVINRNDPWITYIYASLLAKEHSCYTKAYVVLVKVLRFLVTKSKIPPVLAKLSFSLIILATEVSSRLGTPNKTILLARRLRPSKIVPSSNNSLQKEVSHLTSELGLVRRMNDIVLFRKLLALLRSKYRKYIRFEAHWKLCEAYVTAMSEKRSSLLRYKFSQVYHIASSSKGAYVCALAALELYKIENRTRSRPKCLETYANTFKKHVLFCEAHVLEADVPAVAGISIAESNYEF